MRSYSYTVTRLGVTTRGLRLADFMAVLTIEELHQVADLKCDQTIILRHDQPDEIMVTRDCQHERAAQPSPHYF